MQTIERDKKEPCFGMAPFDGTLAKVQKMMQSCELCAAMLLPCYSSPICDVRCIHTCITIDLNIMKWKLVGKGHMKCNSGFSCKFKMFL